MLNRIYKNLTQAICLKKICAQNINSSIFLYIYNCNYIFIINIVVKLFKILLILKSNFIIQKYHYDLD